MRSKVSSVTTVSVALVLWSLTAGALGRQPDAFDACAREPDSAQRLACFDRAITARRGSDQAAAPTPQAKDVRQPRKERPVHDEPAPSPAPIVARIVRVIPRGPYISAFELDNGEVWEQTEAVNFSARPRDEVTIRPGALGSFFLKGADGPSTRVRRVK